MIDIIKFYVRFKKCPFCKHYIPRTRKRYCYWCGQKIGKAKTGKWIPVDSYSAFGGDEVMWEAHGNPIAFYYCSECKEHAYAGEDGESLLTTYCPHCGARMVQEGEDGAD